METRTDTRYERLALLVSRIGVSTTIAIGISVLFGWIFDFPLLRGAMSELVTIKANGALAFVLLGSAAWLHSDHTFGWKYRLGQWCAVAVLILSLLTLGEYVFRWDPGFDELLIIKSQAAMVAEHPGRMESIATVNFLFVALALLLLDFKTRRGRRPAQYLALFAGLLSLLVLLGYGFDLSEFYFGIGITMAMAPQTSLAFLFLVTGVLCLRPRAGLMASFLAEDVGGSILRRLLPVGVVVPLTLYYGAVLGEIGDLFNVQFGFLIVVTGIIIISTIFIYLNARAINRVDRKRREAEESLSVSQKLLESVLNSSPSGIMAFKSVRNEAGAIIDFEWQLLNAAAGKLVGRERAGLFGKKLLVEMPGSRGDGLFDIFVQVVEKGAPLSREHYYEHEKVRSWFFTSAVKLADGCVVIFTDITERKLTEQKLLKLNRLYSVLSNINQAIVRIREKHELLSEVCRIAVEYGGFRFAWIGQADEQGCPVKPIARWGEDKGFLEQADIMPGGGPEQCGLCGSAICEGKTFVTRDWHDDPRFSKWRKMAEERGYRSAIALPLRVLGKVAGNFTLFSDQLDPFDQEEMQLLEELANDISFAMEFMERDELRKQAERQLVQLQQAVESSGEAIFMTDREGVISYINPEFTRLYGFTAEEVVGRTTPRILKSGVTPREVYAHFWQQIINKRIMAGELVNKTKDGRFVNVEGSANAIVDNEGRVIGFLAIQRDITGQKQAIKENEQLQTQLLRAQRIETVGVLAGGIAHDFNNILAIILGNTELAMNGVDQSSRLYADLKEVYDAAKRATATIRQLLLFSRRQPTKELILLDLNTTIKSMLAMVHRLIGENISIKTMLNDDLWRIQANEGHMEQILMNLIINSRDALPHGGHIIIKTENSIIDERYTSTYPESKPGSHVCLTVEDNGIGMDKETMQHVFEPFFSTKEPGKGTGLGLSVVYGIVQQHGGWVNIYSEQWRGATFKIYLPAAFSETPKEIREAAEPGMLKGNGKRILFVDDEQGIRSVMERILRNNGYDVVVASSAGEAMDIFEKERNNFDVIFSDVILPDMKGTELVYALMLKKPGLKVLLGSGYIGEILNEAFMQENNIVFLQKPYDITHLLVTLSALINNP